ncbi:hypothetical protein GDO86_002541 [Hymenochirus boettgeri]|uniref:Uncharacterized protein n=1 Tax=Hymenochirus boettgeri TaxID=247094 RepID=A0A8T2KJL3_9PIPI|nr:hypothetical protein GDO86_002541 [Hymenochirus boettgeri]
MHVEYKRMIIADTYMYNKFVIEVSFHCLLSLTVQKFLVFIDFCSSLFVRGTFKRRACAHLESCIVSQPRLICYELHQIRRHFNCLKMFFFASK